MLLAVSAGQANCVQGQFGENINVIGVVDMSTDVEYFAYQLKYYSTHGKFKHTGKIGEEKDVIIVNGNKL
eukprot:1621519-Karenia_brevis.AAC.1